MEAKSTTNTMQRNVEGNIERASQGAHRAVDRAAETAALVAGRFGDTVEQLAEKRCASTRSRPWASRWQQATCCT